MPAIMRESILSAHFHRSVSISPDGAVISIALAAEGDEKPVVSDLLRDGLIPEDSAGFTVLPSAYSSEQEQWDALISDRYIWPIEVHSRPEDDVRLAQGRLDIKASALDEAKIADMVRADLFKAKDCFSLPWDLGRLVGVDGAKRISSAAIRFSCITPLEARAALDDGLVAEFQRQVRKAHDGLSAALRETGLSEFLGDEGVALFEMAITKKTAPSFEPDHLVRR